MLFSLKSAGVASALAAMLVVTGCSSSVGGNEISRTSAGETASVREGVVVAVRPVTIEGGQGGTLLGTAVGAAIGGIAGAQVGGGDDENAIGGVVGATAGGVIGNQIAKNVGKDQGYAYTIKMNDELVEITQGADIYIEPGTKVYVTFYSDRTRIAPAQY